MQNVIQRPGRAGSPAPPEPTHKKKLLKCCGSPSSPGANPCSGNNTSLFGDAINSNACRDTPRSARDRLRAATSQSSTGSRLVIVYSSDPVPHPDRQQLCDPLQPRATGWNRSSASRGNSPNRARLLPAWAGCCVSTSYLAIGSLRGENPSLRSGVTRNRPPRCEIGHDPRWKFNLSDGTLGFRSIHGPLYTRCRIAT
jgi:hypothetical protein